MGSLETGFGCFPVLFHHVAFPKLVPGVHQVRAQLDSFAESGLRFRTVLPRYVLDSAFQVEETCAVLHLNLWLRNSEHFKQSRFSFANLTCFAPGFRKTILLKEVVPELVQLSHLCFQVLKANGGITCHPLLRSVIKLESL